MVSVCFAADYYIDPVDGNDVNVGSSALPWKTIDYGQSDDSGIAAGDTVYLKEGNYGDVEFRNGVTHFGDVIYGTSWDSPITYIAVTDANVVFDSLLLYAHGDESTTARYLIIEDVEINSSSSGDSAVIFTSASSVKLINLTIIGKWGTYADTTSEYGIQIREAHNSLPLSDVFVEDCNVTHVKNAVDISGDCNEIIIRDNIFHDMTSSALKVSETGITTSGNILIEGNHIYNQYPKEESSGNSAETHGSGISIRSSGITVRRNVIHSYGNTRAIRFYQEIYPTVGYSNMLIENNLVYDTINFTCVELLDIGTNCKFNNNTLIGSYVPTRLSGTGRYDAGLDIDSSGNYTTGSGFEFKNNVIVGRVDVNMAEPYAFDEDNNIIWGHAESIIVGSNTVILTYGADTDVLEINDVNYFEGSGNFFIGGAAFDTYAFHEVNYGSGAQHINLTDEYKLASGSTAIGFADPCYAPSTDLAGVTRDTSTPDAGCYEYVAGDTPSIPTAPTALVATTISSSQINLVWVDNSDNEAGFRVERSKTDSDYVQIDNTAADDNTYSSTGLSSSMVYYYQVRAYNVGGYSAYTTSDSNTTSTESSSGSGGIFGFNWWGW